LLSQYNILVLDEPGNHLDVDTVEALADALLAYNGTVIFTSHDRHFMKRVATNIIEVRDGRVNHYAGNYDAYLYYVNKEIEDGEREEATRRGKTLPKASEPVQVTKPAAAARAARRNEREIRKEISTIEKTIARLDEQKRQSNSKLMETTDAAESLRLHNEVESLGNELAAAEDRWCQLQEELGDEA
jgi:ATP-binding cassette subfamily F protein 3